MEKWIRVQIRRKGKFWIHRGKLLQEICYLSAPFLLLTTRIHLKSSLTFFDTKFTSWNYALPYLDHLRNVALDAEVSIFCLSPTHDCLPFPDIWSICIHMNARRNTWAHRLNFKLPSMATDVRAVAQVTVNLSLKCSSNCRWSVQTIEAQLCIFKDTFSFTASNAAITYPK